MIDLHCHILPGLDDGAQTEQEAIEMARRASADGITDIVATPHTYNGIYHTSAAEIEQSVQRLNLLLAEQQIPVRIHPGAEIHLHGELVSHLMTKDSVTVADQGKYVLLELPMLQLPHWTDEILQELSNKNITPIIAHPERNLVLTEKPELLADWIERYGAVAQVTAASLLGTMGKKAKRMARLMVRQRLVHLIASDGHNPWRRPPTIRAAFSYLMRKEPRQAITFLRNARAVLRGEKCQVAEPMKQKKAILWFY